MSALLAKRGSSVSREHLSSLLGESSTNKTDVHVCYLRRKIAAVTERPIIKTVRGEGYKIAGGLHGVGASVVNALSEWLSVENRRDGHAYSIGFSRGHVTEPFKCVGETDKHGVYVRFKPDPTIFEETVFDYETILTRLRA